MLENNELDWPILRMLFGLLCNCHSNSQSDSNMYNPWTWGYHDSYIESHILWHNQTSSVNGCTIKIVVGYITIYVEGYE